MSDILRNARNAIKCNGFGPEEDRADGYFKLLQDARRRMNDAKLVAIKEAEKPFLEEIETIEEEYAMFLKMAS